MPLKILYIIESTSGGAARHVIDLSKKLLEQGHEIHVIYSPKRINKDFRDFVELTSNLHVYKLNMERSSHSSDTLNIYKIRNYIREQGGFDIVHGHSSKGGALARLATIGMGIPAVYTPHSISTNNPELKGLKYTIFRFIELFLNKIAKNSAIIAVSPSEYEHMKFIGLPKKRLHVVLNGLDLVAKNNRAKLRDEFGVSEKEICVGTVARFCNQKAVDVLLRAMNIVFKECQDIKPVIVGSGELKDELHNIARDLGIGEHIIWLEDITGQEVMTAFDIFALSSNYEAMPYVLVEALKMGLPIVATKVGGTEVTIDDGENGYIVPVGDYETLAKKLLVLLNNPDLLEKMGKNSLQKAQEFTVDKMAKETVGIYKKLLKNN